MEFGEKLKALTSDQSRARLARTAGLKPSVLNNYINRGSKPIADVALKLARVLGVSVEWLIDDDRDLPAERLTKPSPANLSDDDLMHEVARRYRLMVMKLRTWIRALQEIDWEAVTKELYQSPLDQQLKPELNLILEFAWQCYTFSHSAPAAFDPKAFADEHHSEMPGADLRVEELDLRSLLRRSQEWQQTNDWYVRMARYYQLRGDAQIPGRKDASEAERMKILESIGGQTKAETEQQRLERAAGSIVRRVKRH